HPRRARQRGGHRDRARRYHRIRFRRHEHRARHDGRQLHLGRERGRRPARALASHRRDGEWRHGHAAAQRRGHHAALRHRPDAPAVLPRHLRAHAAQDRRGRGGDRRVLRDRHLLSAETMPQRIVILGAGFAGLYAALELERTVARGAGGEVMLIDPQNFLLFTPMLHEVASGALDPSSIVLPTREALRRVQYLQAQTTAVDFTARTVTVAFGVARRTRTIAFDQLLITAGGQTRFPPALRPHVHGIKTIHDALVLRNWLIALLERAEIEDDPDRRQALLTIAVAGGGFSGVETIGAINDFLRAVAP